MGRTLPAQLWRFAAVGATNTAVTLLTYALALAAGMPYVAAGALAFVLGALNGFALNRTWTFVHAGPLGPAGARYAAVQGIGLAADLALLRLGVRGLGLAHLPAQVAAAPPVTLLTFVLSRSWTFRRRAPASPHTPVDRARPAARGRRRAGDPRLEPGGGRLHPRPRLGARLRAGAR
jgi:putative flippase GtrA